jgi:hypothetical protein
LRSHHADFKAVHTSVASMVSDIDQPTMRRPAKSITPAEAEANYYRQLASQATTVAG